MNRSFFPRPPRALRRPGVTLDNIAIVPASLLPYQATYQAIANRLPRGEVLIVLPASAQARTDLFTKAAALWEAKGHRVTLLSADLVAPHRSMLRSAPPPHPRHPATVAER